MPRKTQVPAFHTKYNLETKSARGETNDLPSQTSQGEGITMAEMIRRYTRGEIPPLAQAAFHGHDVDMDKHHGHTMRPDMAEISALAEEERAHNERSSIASDEATPRASNARAKSAVESIEETSAPASEEAEKEAK